VGIVGPTATGRDLLVVNDLGLRPLRDDESLDVYDLIRDRYERVSTILTSNRAIEEWYPFFREPVLASAAMDRLLRRAHVVEMARKSSPTAAVVATGGAPTRRAPAVGS
jgi:DNA replication protein DnaC